jgi:annexin A7/11
MPSFSSILTGAVSSAISAAANKSSSSNQQQHPDTNSGMSGYSNNPYSPPQPGGYNSGPPPPNSASQYPPHNAGYAPQGGGYGAPPNSGYPPSGYSPYGQQPPQGQPPYPQGQSSYGPPQGSSIGFGGDIAGGGYPPQSGYGHQPGYPPAQTGGYGPPSQPGYPPASNYGQPGGYGQVPPQHAPSGYGHPPQSQHSAYPQGGHGVYPTQAMDSVQQQYGRPTTTGPSMNSTPSVKPFPNFNANTDAEALRKAMKGLGCNNTKVIQVLCARTNWQRQEISKAFKVMYGKDLLKELKGELHGDFEELILALMEYPAVYDSHQLRKAMEGLGTRESVLIEIMTTRTNAQIYELKNTYRRVYGRDLEHDLIGETSGHFKRLLVSMCAGGRDESHHVDPLKANQDARALYRAGEQRLGTDESCFNQILASQNFAHLRMVFDEYQKVANHSIERAIESEFSGDIKDGLLAIIKSIRNRPAFFAELLYNSMRGLGTRDTDLIRLVVTRSEVDMAEIRTEYQRLYKTSLEQAIAGDCSGSYKDGLIALVRGN